MPPTLSDNLKTRALTLGESILTKLSQWYEAGTFKNPWGEQWVYTSSAPAALCASLFVETANPKYLATSIEAWDYAIDNLFHPSNYFIDVANSATNLERIVFATHLSWTLFILGNQLDAAHQKKWLAAVKGNIEQLETSGELIWYANGNWSANQVRMLYLATQVCKQQGDTVEYARYNTLYERNVVFLTTPVTTDPKWAGYGLVTDVAGGWADWSDYQAHLTELNGGPPIPNAGAGTSWNNVAPFGTYDGDYAGLALEHLTQWFAVSRDIRALKILNGYTNKYLSTVNTTTWIGNFSNGSRHNNPGNGINTPALPVLALLGERQVVGALAAPFTDAQVLAQWDVMVIPSLSQYTGGNIPFAACRSLLNVIGTVLYACDQSQQRL